MHNTTENKDTPEWVSRQERSNTLAIRLIVWIALTLGRRAARLFLYRSVFTSCCSRRSQNRVQAVSAQSTGTRAAHPGWLPSYPHLRSTILDRVFLLNGRFDKLNVRTHRDDATESMMAQKKGCILLGAHFGSFEIMRAYADQIKGPPANVVMYEENARKLNAVLHAINPNLAQQVIGLGKVDSMLKVEQALQRGEFIASSQTGAGTRRASISCNFLGEAAQFPTGPLRMAYILKCPVFLMMGVYRAAIVTIYILKKSLIWRAGRFETRRDIKAGNAALCGGPGTALSRCAVQLVQLYDFWK